MMRLIAALAVLAGCASSAGPVIRAADRPKLVAVYAVPPDSLINHDQGVASLYDDYMYYWANTRPRLDSLGVLDDTQPLKWTDRRFTVRDRRRCWSMRLDEGQEVAYLLLVPGQAPRLMTGLRMNIELGDSTAAYLREPPPHAASAATC